MPTSGATVVQRNRWTSFASGLRFTLTDSSGWGVAPYPGSVLRSLRTSSGGPAFRTRAVAALTLLGLLVLSAPLVLVPLLSWLVDLLG